MTSSFDESPPLSTIAPSGSAQQRAESPHMHPPNGTAAAGLVVGAADGALDSGDQCLPDVIQPNVNFEGINNSFGARVPDTVGDVGPNHYVQMVNRGMAVFNKTTGERLLDLNLGQIWSDFPTAACAEDDNTDPIVLYDQFADRWILTELTLGCIGRGNDVACYNCIAVSKTCLLYTSPSPRDGLLSRMPSSA